MNKENKEIGRQKIFALHPIQRDLANKYCFETCGQIIIGSLYDEKLGAMYPCREEHCEYEEDRAYIGENLQGDEVWIRKLSGDKYGKH